MKQATGELNMTVIIVLLIAMLATFFFSYLWPNIRNGFRHDSRCDDAICPCPQTDPNTGKCLYDGGEIVECYFKGNEGQKIKCAWKG